MQHHWRLFIDRFLIHLKRWWLAYCEYDFDCYWSKILLISVSFATPFKCVKSFLIIVNLKAFSYLIIHLYNFRIPYSIFFPSFPLFPFQIISEISLNWAIKLKPCKFQVGCGSLANKTRMVLETILSPQRRSASFKRQFPRDELGSWSTLLQRHRFLLTALALLGFLCTVYLYFAVTLSATESCTGLTGAQRAQCQLEHVKTSVSKGKLKFF